MTGTMPVFDMLSNTLAKTREVSAPTRDGSHVKSFMTVGDDPRQVKIMGDMFDPNRIVITVYRTTITAIVRGYAEPTSANRTSSTLPQTRRRPKS